MAENHTPEDRPCDARYREQVRDWLRLLRAIRDHEMTFGRPSGERAPALQAAIETQIEPSMWSAIGAVLSSSRDLMEPDAVLVEIENRQLLDGRVDRALMIQQFSRHREKQGWRRVQRGGQWLWGGAVE